MTARPAAPGTVRTDRLALRRIAEADRADMVRFLGTPEVMEIRKFGVLDAAAAGRVVDGMLAHWEEHGFGMRMVLDAGSGRFLGECGLRFLEDGTFPEISYGLLPVARGRGLATEAAAAAMREGFETLGFDTIVAFSRGDNTVSHRVLEKVGMRRIGAFGEGRHQVLRFRAERPLASAAGRG